jgi:hypothetical protein
MFNQFYEGISLVGGFNFFYKILKLIEEGMLS